jgi:cytidyltransferase-like protein
LSIQVVKTIREMQDIAERFRCNGKIIAVVPTMGFLHRGHTSLIERARSRADVVITTIFVNPTQFAPNEDYNRYPRDFDHDKIIAADAGTDIIFFPDAAEMYPQKFNSKVEVERASKILEGALPPDTLSRRHDGRNKTFSYHKTAYRNLRSEGCTTSFYRPKNGERFEFRYRHIDCANCSGRRWTGFEFAQYLSQRN